MVVEKPAGLLTAPTPESDRSNLLSLLQRREEEGGGRGCTWSTAWTCRPAAW